MNSFAQNINYIAGLDNVYGSKVELYKNNLSLKNVEHDIELKFSYYNNDDKKIHSIIHSEPGVLVGGINDLLLSFKSIVDASITGSEFTCTISYDVQNFVFNNVLSIVIDSHNDTYKAYELELKVVTAGAVTYDLFGEVSDTLKILPSLAMITRSDINAMANAYDIRDEITNIGNNVASITTVSDSIENVNITGTNITNVNTVSSNIVDVNTVATNITGLNSIVSNMVEILSTDENAAIATAKALEASNSAADAEASASAATNHIADKNNPHEVTKSQIGLENVTNFDTTNASNITSGTLSSAILPLTGVSAGTYNSVTVDITGRITSATNPTTIAGFGITDAYTKTEVQETLPAVGIDTTNTTAPTRAGQLKWNQDEGTVDLRLQNGVILQLGQENNRLVRASGDIANGRLCMFDGTIGNSGRVKVKHFTGLFAEHSLIYGIATQNITSGSDGYITINGKIRDIDTTGASYGEVWADEDVIYAKPNDNGALTNIEPNDDQLKMIVATVIHAHTSGTLEIRVLPFNENMIAKKANKLTTSRNVLLSGDVSGSAYFDGSSDIDINVSVSDNSHNHTISNITGLSLLNLDRADKYLSAQNIANMIYVGDDLTKIQYNTATDIDYEILTYGVDGLSNIAHYINSILTGNTVLTYTDGDLVSAVYTGE